MKIISMYLPQYHQIEENNKWWGEGFTEWTNVKKSVPLFEGHLQPRSPLNGNYYDLANPDVIINQMNIAREYGVDAFAIYHYWFKGKKLLEKPVEKLIDYDSLPIDYCFCWANEPWTRTWDGDLGAKEILMPQNYGDEKDWDEHYNYFKQFFCKKNYIKYNDMPLIIIYSSCDIDDRKKMFSRWDELAKKDGYRGIYVMIVYRVSFNNGYINYGDSIMDFEPFATLSFMNQDKRTRVSCLHEGIDRNYKVFDYKAFCEEMVDRRYFVKNKHFYGLFTGWDNSPRRGKETKIIFDNNAPDVFQWVFEKQLQKTSQLCNEFFFINAWNEWGEGTFLEPDEKYKFGYLEAIRNVRRTNGL